MPSIADRVKETTTTIGTGTVSLGGAVAGFRAFSSAFTSGTVVYYCITDGTNWEVGYGAATTGTPWTLARSTVLASSNAGSLVSFGAGTKDVFCTAPAAVSDVHAATSKTTPIDADEVWLWDSVTGLLNRLTWANLKATAKTYFDTLYQAIDAQLSSLVRQNSQSAAYTLVLTDSGKHILHPSADTTARIFTIPANGSVAYSIGTALTFVNQNGAGVITIAITTDTMRLAGPGITGSRTLAANGIATALKITSTEWVISGTGLT